MGPILKPMAIKAGELGSQGRESIGHSIGATNLPVTPRGDPSNPEKGATLVDK